MFNNLLQSIFASDYRGEITSGQFNHCSSICQYRNGAILAWYAGSGECRDDQSVHISFFRKNSYTEPVRLGDKTGNPIVFSHRDRAFLLWSQFEEDEKIRSLVDRWKFCSLWIQEIGVHEKIEFVSEPQRISEPNQHLLGRCNPIVVYETLNTSSGITSYLLPLYDELNRNCVIYLITLTRARSGYENIMEINKWSTFGDNMIQPTVWKTKDGCIHSLSRNFDPTRKHLFSRYSSTYDGKNWTKPKDTNIKNNNSSLHAITWKDHHLLLWNDTNNITRRNLRLGLLELTGGWCGLTPQATAIQDMSSIGSYPSMCVDSSNRLHMTFTNESKIIEHHVWTNRKFKEASRRSD
jgi:predicted neuraminidase